jgi:hypothetical protein
MPKQTSAQRTAFVRHVSAILATGALAVAIAYLTLTPFQLDLDLDLGSDKLYHLIAFAALVLPCALFYASTLIWVLPAGILFGGAIELIQPYVGRGGELADFGADALGVVIGAALGLSLRAIAAKYFSISAASTK